MTGTPRALLQSLQDVFTVSSKGEIKVHKPAALKGEATDRLIHAAVFGSAGEMEASRWLIRALAREVGVVPASIQSLYEAMGREETGGFTTPAMNLRGMAYDMARAAVRAMLASDAGPAVFELARSEMGYAFMNPSEYGTVILAAAMREGYQGPLFIQGDHFQVNAKKFHTGGASRDGELKALRTLIADAIDAGFYNIDIDASTLVVLERPSVKEQQRDNFEQQAELTSLVRQRQPASVTISVGGEIGEVGGKNSTPEEFRAFADNFNEVFAQRSPGSKGISKISVQTGTSHGGVPMPDGTVAKVKLDFEVLRSISTIARSQYGMAGAVQHGASTLPAEAFSEFPKHEAAEVHLATEFQNLTLDHPDFPRDLRAEMLAWCDANCADERKPGMTAEQFHYKTRKKTWGPFKPQTWGLPEATRASIRDTLQSKFEFLFQKLNVAGRMATVRKFVKPPDVRVPPPASLNGA